MTEELLNVLTKVKSLRVPGRSSSFAFKGRNEDDIFRKVGEQLHVNAVLEGSVRKAGDKLRITAQLINVADGFHLWSETYDRDMQEAPSPCKAMWSRCVVDALQEKVPHPFPGPAFTGQDRDLESGVTRLESGAPTDLIICAKFISRAGTCDPLL